MLRFFEKKSNHLSLVKLKQLLKQSEEELSALSNDYHDPAERYLSIKMQLQVINGYKTQIAALEKAATSLNSTSRVLSG